MPDGTSKTKWEMAQILRRSDLTEMLEDLFDDPPALKEPPFEAAYRAFKTPNALRSDSPEWTQTLKPFVERLLGDYVSDPGLSLTQKQLIKRVIDHIQDWPNSPGPPRNGKEQLREVLVAVIDANVSHRLKFKWSLINDNDFTEEEIKIQGDPGQNDISAGDIGGFTTAKKIKVSFVNPKSKEYEDPGEDFRIRIGPE